MSLNLKPVEVKELIARYESELRKMSFQRQMVVKAVTELENMLGLPNNHTNIPPLPVATVAVPQTQTAVVSTPNIPKVEQTAIATRTDTIKPKNGFKLTKWDKFIIYMIQDAEEGVPTIKLLNMFRQKNISLNLEMDDRQVRGKLSRSLHKLANQKNALNKEDYDGKGYVYTINYDVLSIA